MSETFVLFDVAGTLYAVRSANILLVEMVGSISPVPRAPAFVEGVMAVRGMIIPVISMRQRFHISMPVELDERQKLRERVIVIRLDGRTIGLRVDAAREFIRISDDQLQPVPESLNGPGVEYLEGIIAQSGRLILIINLVQIFEASERRELLDQGEAKFSS